jgi:siroheme synthase
MGAGQAAAIAATLIEHGMAPTTPVAIVENASLPSARCVVTQLAQLHCAAAREFSGPALIVVGAALTTLAQSLAGARPLHVAA